MCVEEVSQDSRYLCLCLCKHGHILPSLACSSHRTSGSSAVSLSEWPAGKCPGLVSSWSPNKWRTAVGERTLSLANSAATSRAPPPRSTTLAGLSWGSWLLGKESFLLEVTQQPHCRSRLVARSLCLGHKHRQKWPPPLVCYSLVLLLEISQLVGLVAIVQ